MIINSNQSKQYYSYRNREFLLWQTTSGSGSHLPPSLQTDRDSLPKQLKVILCPCNAGTVPEMIVIEIIVFVSSISQCAVYHERLEKNCILSQCFYCEHGHIINLHDCYNGTDIIYLKIVLKIVTTPAVTFTNVSET